MLLSFRFANHRSFVDEQHLNLLPVYALNGGATETTEARRCVPVAGIFGANASGKSNCLHALSFMQRMVVSSDRAVEPGYPLSLDREPFRLDPDLARAPSRYIVDLSLNDIRHTYGFTVDDTGILEEWLFHYPLRKRRRIFERDGDRFLWGEESGKDADLGRIAAITAPAALFISTIARFSRRGGPDGSEHQPLHDVYRWFFRTRTRSRPGFRPLSYFSRMWPDSDELRRIIIGLLRAADVGIIDVVVEDDQISELTPGLDDLDVEPSRLRSNHQRRRLMFKHRGPAEAGLLGIEEESTGTRQLLDLAYVASGVLRNGGAMTVDELDASLHPMLTAKLIGLFRDPVTNPKGSQLIFSSHDATLLGTFDAEEVLGRDEIWFTEKGKDGTTSLYPLTDFKPRRQGENRQRRYLNGNYGGVPELSMHLFERALATREVSEEDGAE